MIDKSQVESKSNSSGWLIPGVLQRKCACGNHTMGGNCTDCKKKGPTLQRAVRNQEVGTRDFGVVPSVVNEALQTSGHALDVQTRGVMESRFGHDFSRVRVHTDGRAAESASAVNALAYTVGNDVVFGSGQYAPGASAGSRLLAHELTHVVQQQGAGSPALQRFPAGPADDPLEREADQMSDSAVGRSPFDRKPGGTLPYRQAQELAECIRIIGDAASCRETVLGEKAPATPAAPATAPESTQKPGAAEEQKVTIQPPAKNIPASEVKVTAEKSEKHSPSFTIKGAGKFGVSKPFVKGEHEESGAGELTAEVEKEGVAAGALSIAGQGAKATSATGEKSHSQGLDGKVELKFPVGAWMFGPNLRERLAPWMFFKDLKFGFGFGAKFEEAEILRKLAFEASLNVVTLALEDKKVPGGTLNAEIAASVLGKAEGERGGHGPWATKGEFGAEVVPGLKFKPRGGPWFIFVEGSFKVTRTREGGHWLPGVFNFGVLGGVGVTLPRAKKH